MTPDPRIAAGIGCLLVIACIVLVAVLRWAR